MGRVSNGGPPGGECVWRGAKKTPPHVKKFVSEQPKANSVSVCVLLLCVFVSPAQPARDVLCSSGQES